MPALPRAFFLYGTIAHYRVREGQLPGRHIGYLPTSLQILFGSRLQVYIATYPIYVPVDVIFREFGISGRSVMIAAL